MCNACYPLILCLSAVLLSACGNGANDLPPRVPEPGPALTLVDTDIAADQVAENARPGALVGLTIAAHAANSGGTFTYSLADDAAGAFAIDSATGVVRLAGSVDYEAAADRTIVARAVLTSGNLQSVGTAAFKITVLDSPPPALELTFPFAHARHSDSTISVSGRVSHPQPQTVQVTAQAGGATVVGNIVGDRFTIRDIPVSGAGNFTLTVTASHAGGDSASQQMHLSREPELTWVQRMVLDPTRNRVLLADRESGSIIAAPLDGGPRVLLSGRYVGSGPAFVHPAAITISPQGDSFYVADDAGDAIFKVSMANGDRSQLPAGEPRIYAPNELAFDTMRNRLLLSDEQVGIVAIDTTTGERQLVSSGQSAGPQIYYHRGVGFDAARDRIIVNDSNSLFSVNPLTGVRTMLSDGIDEPFPRLFGGMSVVSASGKVYVGDEFGNGVVRIDLLSGNRETVTSSGLALFDFPAVGAGANLQYPDDVAFDTATNRLFLIEAEYADPLIEVHSNGDREVIRDASLGTGVHFRSPAGLKYDALRHVLIAADYVADFVAEIDPSTGNRTLLSGRSDGYGSIDTDPTDVSFSAASREYYIVDFQTKTLYAVRDGATRIVSSPTIGSGPPFLGPRRIDIDESRGVAYVLDEQSILAVDIQTGTRRVIMSDAGAPAGMALDLPNERLFVSDSLGSIRALDLANEAQLSLSPGSSYSWSGGLAYDSANARLLEMDEGPFRLVSIDAKTGVRTALPGAGIEPVRPHSIAVDPERQVAFVTEDAYDAVIAIDLQSGYRQLIAK